MRDCGVFSQRVVRAWSEVDLGCVLDTEAAGFADGFKMGCEALLYRK